MPTTLATTTPAPVLPRDLASGLRPDPVTAAALESERLAPSRGPRPAPATTQDTPALVARRRAVLAAADSPYPRQPAERQSMATPFFFQITVLPPRPGMPVQYREGLLSIQPGFTCSDMLGYLRGTVFGGADPGDRVVSLHLRPNEIAPGDYFYQFALSVGGEPFPESGVHTAEPGTTRLELYRAIHHELVSRHGQLVVLGFFLEPHQIV